MYFEYFFNLTQYFLPSKKDLLLGIKEYFVRSKKACTLGRGTLVGQIAKEIAILALEL